MRARIIAMWQDCRRAHERAGPWLFGEFSIADAMYAPIVSRFITYDIDLEAHGDKGAAAAYCAAMMDLPSMKQWENDARAQIAAGR